MHTKQILAELKQLGMPAFRAKQAVHGYFVELLGSWQDLKVWPADLRNKFTNESWSPLRVVKIAEGKAEESIKFLLETEDKKLIETVIMRHEDGRNTVCVSSQVGCPMGCAFCATGKMGLARNLSAEEIVDQVIQAGRYLKDKNGKVTNIVLMGMGEPFANIDNVFESLEILTSPEGFGLGARHISVSTCGLVPGIQKMAREFPQVNLAISLHAPNQAIREKIMPVAKAYPLQKLMRGLAEYMNETNRKVMFEYVMIDGVNDSTDEAEELADLLEPYRRLAHVNLIKYHDTGVFKASTDAKRRAFANRLKRRGIAVTQRVSFGEEITAACGQLATVESEQ